LRTTHSAIPVQRFIAPRAERVAVDAEDVGRASWANASCRRQPDGAGYVEYGEWNTVT
jgi:hypothetical protein